jgi:AraC family transcriptional regulator
MYEDDLLEEIKRFVLSHLQEEITLGMIADAICYSEEHTSRFFKQQTGQTLFDFVRSQRLIQAAEQIREKGGKIVNTAVDFGFNSHEVFTRSFSAYFGISPKEFRMNKPEIKHFMPKGYKVFPWEYKENEMDGVVIFTQVVEKPKRQLLFYPGKKATHYFEYCNEVGCDVWGKLLEVENTMNEPLGLWLPKKLRTEGISEYVQGVEIQAGQNVNLPGEMVSIPLPASTYMLFQSQPYEEDEKRFMEVIQQVQAAMKLFNPGLYGYEWAYEDAPRYQLEPIGQRGYIEAVPIRKVK